MSTTLTAAYSTSMTTTGTATSSTANTSRINIKLFFSQIYLYITVSFQFLYTLIVPTKLIKSTKKIPLQQEALQYYKNKTLILDLDETLVHSVRLGTTEMNVSPSIIHKNIEVQCDKQNLIYQVYKRPHVDFFLKTISQWYRIVIYTASMAEYADPVIDWLDQDNLISQRFFRQSCILKNGNFLKDVTLAEQDLNKVCLVDNSPIAFDLYKENGIPLPTWISNPNDESLLDLLPFLDALRFAADVRSILKLQHKSK